MAGKFELRKFSDIDINDPFFDSLKSDYPGTSNSTGFTQWFNRKVTEGKTALVFDDEQGIGAFVCIKTENEAIQLKNEILPQTRRLKISTLRIAERYRGQRLGEGAIGLILWKWQELGLEDVYVTVFDKQDVLISQLTKYGFELAGRNLDGECVYLRSRKSVDYSDPYKSFPFINPGFQKAGYLIVDDVFHDTLFPYSELKNNKASKVVLDVSNGISKIYVGSPYTPPHYKSGEPVFIYRKHTGTGAKKYKSCLTTYCVVKEVITVKSKGTAFMSYSDYLKRVGNKSVYKETDLQTKYNILTNLVLVDLVYYGYFGEGNNVNMDWLSRNGCWGNCYPTQIRLTPEQFKKILREGNINVDNVIID